MKKNESAIAEEKKLVWRFQDLPTAGEVAELVDTKVITPEEARAILFKEEVKKSDEVEALKEMVNALQEMVKDLLSRQNNVQFIPYTKVIEIPTRLKPYWDREWMSGAVGSSGVINCSSTAGYSDGSTSYSLSIKQ